MPPVGGLVWPDYNTAPMFHVWAQAEAVRWWLPSGPLPVPLVTTGDPTTDPLAGNLGHPTTRVLFGGGGPGLRADHRGPAHGRRGRAGAVGGEVSVLWLDAREVTFGARSDPTGSPALYVPVFNLATGREGSVIVADPVFGVGRGGGRPQPVRAVGVGGQRARARRPRVGRGHPPGRASGTWT